MAPVVAFIKAGLTFIATAGASGSAMAALTIVTTTLSFAATRMIKNKLNFSVDDNDRSRQTTVRSTIEPRKLVYGETMVSGPLTYAQVSGANNKYLHQVVALAGHELTQISKLFLDDKSIDLTNGSIYNSTTKAVTSGFFGPKNDEGGNSETVVYIDTRLGTASQTAYAGLRSDSVTSQEYLSTHRGDNVASLYTRWTINEGSREVWDEVGNVQNIKALVKGKKIYDPRLEVNAGGTAGASPTNASYVVYDNDTLSTASIDRGEQGRNPALMIADYLMDDEFGLGIPSSKIDWSAIIAAADDCDTLVPIPNSATQKRFFGSGVIFGADPYAKSIQKILSGMNGSLVYSQGKYIARAGVYVAPTESITENDIIGEVDIRTAVPRSDRLNQIKGLFIDPTEQYKMMEFGPVTVSGAIARDNGEVLEEEIKLPFTDNRYAAQRIAFKQVNQSFLQTMITVPVNLKGMRIAVGDRVNVYLTDLESVDSGSWNPKIFKCIDWSFADNGSGGINLTLIEDVATRYADPAASDYSTITAEGTITTSLPDVPAPTNFSATAAINSIELAWENPPNTAAWEQIWVYSNTSNTAPTDSSTPIAKFRGTSFTDTVPGGTEKYYWIQAVRYPQGSTPSSGNANKAKSVLVASSPTNVTASKVVNAVMAADSINTAQIVDDAVGSAKIGTTIQSDNWVSSSGAAGWQINKAGSATFQTATIKGSITATSGAIGGLTIGSDKVYVGTGTFNNANTAFYVDDQGQLSLKDKLSWDGTDLTISGSVTATSGTFSGTVNASAGAFTGDVSTDSKFIAGSGATSATMDGGDPEFKLYAGAAAPADASFKVDSTGIVTATRLVVTRPDDTTAIMFDSAQDGLVGIGLAAVSQETGIVVQNPSVEITSSNPNPALVLSASQTITLTLLVGTPATKKATSTGGEYPSDITATIEYSTNSGSSWSTFGSAVQLTRTVTLGSSDATKYGVATSSNTGTGVRAYKRGIHSIDSIGNLQFVRSVSGFAAGSYIFRVSLSQTAGSDTDMNVSTSPPFTLKFATDAAGFTVAANGTLSDAPSATATIGYVQANYMALANGNTITVGSGETNDFQDESGNSVLIVSDTKTEARNTLEVTYTSQYPTTDKIFRIKDYNSTVESFSIQEDGWVNNWTGIKVGAGYGSTGTTIDASGNISTDGNVVIGGDLTVSGTTTTVNTDDLTVKDPNITLNYSTGDSSSTANNAGITIQDAVDASTDASILWKTATDTFDFSHGVNVTGTVTATGDVESKGGNELRVYRTDNLIYGSIEYLTGAGGLKLRDVNGDGMTFSGATSDYLTITGAGAATFSGEVLIPEKLSHVGDTDTHLKFAGANDIRIVAGGVDHAAFDGTIVFNQSGSSTMDFRVESDTQENMLFVDASLNRVGIANNAPASTLDVTGSVTAKNVTANNTAEGDTYFTGGTANSRLLNVFTSTHDSSANAGHNFKIASGEGAFIFGNNTTANLLTVKTGGIAVNGSIDSGNITSTGTINMNHDGAALYFGADIDMRITHDGANGTFRNDTGNLTIDVAGEIILDADLQGSGNGILLKDAGTLYGSIFRSSSHLHIKSEASDKDMLFMGNDGGSEITALTLNMSEAGAATFNDSVTANKYIMVGGSQIGQDYAYIKSASASNASLTLRKDSTDADSIDFLQLRNDGNGLIGKIEGDGDISFKAATFSGSVTSAGLTSSGDAIFQGNVTHNNNNASSKYFKLNVASSGDGHLLLQRNNTNYWQIHSDSSNVLKFDGYNGASSAAFSGDVTSAGLEVLKAGGGKIRISETAARYVEIIGYAEGSANGSTMAFHTVEAGSSTSMERMRLDYNGQLLLGTVLNVFGGADRYGYNFFGNGQSNQSIDGTGGAVAQYINRENADGVFTKFHKDRSELGSIFNSGTTMGIGSLDTGVLLANNIDAILPWNASTNAERGDAIDLGRASSGRFRALYLSGSANVGGDVNVFGANRKILVGESGAGGTFGFMGWDDASNVLYLGNSYNSAFNKNIVINGSGFVGIGTNNPLFKLHCSGANTQIAIESTTTHQNSSLYYRAHGASQWEVGVNITAGLDYEIYDRVNNASRFVVSHSGNVGIGTSGYGTYFSGNRVISLGSGTTIRAPSIGAPYITIASNAYQDGSSWKYVQTHPASNYEQYNGTHTWSYAASGTAGNSVSFSEAMRITSAGDLYYAQTQGSSTVVGHIIQKNGKAFHIADGNNPLHLTRLNSDGDIQQFYKGSAHIGSIGTYGGTCYIGGAGTLGGFMFNGSIEPTRGSSRINGAHDLGSNSYRFRDLFLSGSANVGSVTASGNITAYSDGRLKENIETLDGSKVMQMRGVSFTKDGKAGSGVIAQELELVASELVNTADDEMGTKSVAYGNLVGYLIENAKQQQAEINELKTLIKKLMEK